MGIYEYLCDCGRVMELMVKLEDKPTHLNCDTCRGIAKPIMSATPTSFRQNDRKAFKRQGH